MKVKRSTGIVILIIFALFILALSEEETCSLDGNCKSSEEHKYVKETNELDKYIQHQIKLAEESYIPCHRENCNCHKNVIDNDLKIFKNGITKTMFEQARKKATAYQIVNGTLYRDEACMFPARCAGIEHYLLALVDKMVDLEFVINTRDWPQVGSKWEKPLPIFSFSKTKDYYDIMYPAWSFWEGGPAISLYPTGLGKWNQHRQTITSYAEKHWPWEKKYSKAFFRGSRTSSERDALILLSRSNPDLVDAQYTKNQAWKSDADTLHAPPASEVSLQDHCKYKYLFNYRGVAASFRFKHLFLCKSLVFHVGDEWLEFFYPSMKPWIHYIPINSKATESELKKYLNFFREHDTIAEMIAKRGYSYIWDNLREKDVKCYWRKLLKSYKRLLKYEVLRDKNMIEIKQTDQDGNLLY